MIYLISMFELLELFELFEPFGLFELFELFEMHGVVVPCVLGFLSVELSVSSLVLKTLNSKLTIQKERIEPASQRAKEP